MADQRRSHFVKVYRQSTQSGYTVARLGNFRPNGAGFKFQHNTVLVLELNGTVLQSQKWPH